MKRLLLSLCIIHMLLLAACSASPQTTAAAVAVVQEFLRTHQTGDAIALHALLTEKAQQAMPREQVVRYLQNEKLQYSGLGTPLKRGDAWLQVPVLNLEIQRQEDHVGWGEKLLTVHYDGRRWRVAWIEPLLFEGHQRYERSTYVEELEIGRLITEIDPFHYRGYLEQHFAYRGLKEYRLAEQWLVRASQAATPAQMPDVLDATARFKLSVNQPTDAALQARNALTQAAPLIPSTYSHQWEADTLVVLAKALLVQGDRAGAEEAAKRAGEADPQNGSLAIFRWQLSALQP